MNRLNREEAKQIFIKTIDYGVTLLGISTRNNNCILELRVFVPDENDPLYKDNSLGVHTPRELMMKFYQSYYSININYIADDIIQKMGGDPDKLSEEEHENFAEFCIDNSADIMQIAIRRDRRNPSDFEKKLTRQWAFETYTGLSYSRNIDKFKDMMKEKYKN